MKRILAATALSSILAAQSALAGGIAPSQVAPVVIAEETSSSAGGILVPVVALILIALALHHGGGAADVVPMVSDARLKTDITPVGVAANGLTIYEFRYLGDTQLYRGVMAQEVLAYMPEAVHTMLFGYMAVDYGLLGMEMTAVN